jgi:hypothetical protein
MKISEYISVLQSIAAEHGDLEVETTDTMNYRITANPPRLAHRAILKPRERKPRFYTDYMFQPNAEAERKGEAVCRIG